MGLLQEWYVQETKDSEEEKTHRPLNDEQLFSMPSAPATLISYAKTAGSRNLPKRKGWVSFPVTPSRT